MATAGLLAALLTYLTIGVVAERRTIDPPAATGMYGGSEEQRATVNRAMELMERAALHLPDLRIYIHDGMEGCGGYKGRFGLKSDPFRVDICHPDIRVALHELAHAWERHNLDDATRSAFMDFVGSPSWNNWDHSHPVRGIEQAAWAIVWGVREAPLQALALRPNAVKLKAYELLTGMPSPRIAHLSHQGETAMGDGGLPSGGLPNSVRSVDSNLR